MHTATVLVPTLRRLGAIVGCIVVMSCDRTAATKTAPSPSPNPTFPDAGAVPVTSPAVIKGTNEDRMDETGVEVLVSCVGVRSTGKRHNSMFFTFRIEQNIRGELGQDEYTSQEIFWDFGAGQIVEKLGMKFDSSATGIGKGMTTASCAHRGVLKLVPDPERGVGDASTGWRILWAAREGEADAARALERVARALVSAVESKDLEPVRAHLAPNSNVTKEEILAIAREEGRFEPGDFARKTYWALLGERRGVVYVGGGGAYTLQLVRDAGGRWTIARIEWRR